MSTISGLAGTGINSGATIGQSSSSSPVTVNGLVSGINTSALITALEATQQQKVTTLQNQQSTVTNTQSAFDGIEAQVDALQGALTPLTRAQNNVFDASTATSSDTSIVNAAASSNAAAGTYNLTVNTLAAANAIASQGFAGTSSQITQGTLTLNTGSGATNITVDSTNDTLQGLADAINSSGAAVAASIVNDGSGGGQQYHLLLTSKATGTANAINITNNLAATGGGATQPTFNTTVQAASDASVTLGSGAGALTVSSSSNTLSSLIPGVTLSLQNAAPNTPVSVTVGSDTASITTDINTFVSAYNNVISSIQQETSYNATTGQASPLLGDAQTQSVQDQLLSMVEGAVPGANAALKNLGVLGITMGSNGQLSVNSATLNSVLSGGVPGVTLADVGKLFALTGSSTNPGVQFVTGSNQTQSSGNTPYTLNVTRAAQQASLVAGNALAGSTVIDGSNDTFTVNVNGLTSDSLTLASGTYTQTQLAQAVASAINGDSALNGQTVSSSVNGSGQLVLNSGVYGSASQVAMESGTALPALGYTSGALAKGIDVAGNFVVNGVTEAATGNGQYLTGNTGNANTAGLELQVSLTPTQVGAGVSTAVTVSNGIAAQLDNYISSLTNPATGVFQNVDSGYQSQISAIKASITQQNTFIQQQTTELQTKYAKMEQTLAKLQESSSIITAAAQNFAAITNNTNSSSSSSGG